MATKKKGIVAKSPSRKKTTKKKTRAQKVESKKKTAKKTASKKPAVRKTTTSPAESRARQKMIAETAYFLSLQRGSEKSSALEDWLIAEAQVDQKLAGPKD